MVAPVGLRGRQAVAVSERGLTDVQRAAATWRVLIRDPKLAMSIGIDVTPFVAAIRHAMFLLWAISDGDAYDKATARVVTAIGLERTA